jgi:serine protease Do
MDKPHGALVAKVLPDSPAAAAGIKPGDVVVDFNGVEIDLSSDLPPLVGGTEVGKKIPVEIVRDGKSLKLDLEIGELPPEEELKHASSDKADTATDNRLKIAVKDLTDKQREELELAGHGVVVESVQLGPARRAGIRKGDIVTMIDDERVKDAKHFKELVEALPAGKSVPILVQRAGQPIFLAIKVPAQ